MSRKVLKRLIQNNNKRSAFKESNIHTFDAAPISASFGADAYPRQDEFMREAQTLKAVGHDLNGQLRRVSLAKALGYDSTENMRRRFDFEAHPFVRRDGKQWEANTSDVIEHLVAKSAADAPTRPPGPDPPHPSRRSHGPIQQRRRQRGQRWHRLGERGRCCRLPRRGFDVWELGDAWSWLDATEEGRALAKAYPGSIHPGSPLNHALAAWCWTRPVVVDIRADAAGPEALALEILGKAIRVKTAASIVRIKL